MTDGTTGGQRAQANQPLEVSIQIGLAALLVIGCLLILRPFVPLIMWGIIVAIASYPTFTKLERVLKRRRTLAAVLWTLMLLAVLVVPLLLLGQSLVQGVKPIVANLRDGSYVLPPPPASVETWPVIGHWLARTWAAASLNLTDAVMRFAPQIKSAIPGILAASADFGLTLLQFFVAVLLSGVLLANADGAAKATRSLMNRLFGEQGPEFQQLIGATVRSVTFGILGVALIQTAFAAVGFFVAGLPAAGIWSVVFLAGAVLQMGGLVLVPALIYYFAIASTAKAVAFLIWCAIVGVMDNVLKPVFLGRGAAVPVVVVFLGVIGGFIAMGLVGLFVGAIVLSVGYKLFLAWIEGRAGANETVATAPASLR
jgi:predicted PurR-regulated permease PerM